MDSAKSLELSLQKGPDLIALSLDISEQAPFEGELIFICGTAINDNTYNPNAIKVIDARLGLLMDGQILTHLPVEYFSNGSQISISTAWVATPGWHNVSISVVAPLNATDVLPDNNVLTRRLYVARLPACRLVANGADFNAWERVNFSIEVNSSDAVTGYRYDFGDGYVSDWILSPNVSHVFSTPGEYSVRGWVVTSRGVLRECAEPLRVRIGFPSSALELFASPDPAVSNKPVLFTARIAPGVGNITLAIWQFGDGGYSYGKDPSVADHTYGGPGNYSVTLTLNIEGGGSLVGRLHITVLNLLPRAVARISPENGDATTSFSFVSESQDADGRILACRWDLGDGTVVISPRVTHGYASHGVFNVTLTVQDDWGQWSDPVETVVTVDNSPPAASLRADRNSAETGKAIMFSALGTSDIDDPAANLSYHWDLGDGKTAEGLNVSHPFSSPGRYEVKLTVDDGAGGRTTKSFTVHILGEPVGQAGWLVPSLISMVVIVLILATAVIASRRSKKDPLRPGPRKNGMIKSAPPSRLSPKPMNNVKRPNDGRSK
jgi:PKD repeat protein